MIQIVVPMAGNSSRFTEKGYIPKPFLPLINGKTVIEVIDNHINFLAYKSNLSINKSFLIKEEFLKNDTYKFLIWRLMCKYYEVKTPNLGPLATISQIVESFKDDDQLIIYDCDQLSIFSLKNLIRENRGVVLTHKNKSPSLSYIGFDYYNVINKVVEKEVISNDACCGVYYFPSVKIFKEAALHDFSRNLSLNGEFRIANLYNYLLKKNIPVDNYEAKAYFNLGTPEQYELFKDSFINSYNAYLNE